MADTEAPATSEAQVTSAPAKRKGRTGKPNPPRKAKAPKEKKVAESPKTSILVNDAVKGLAERGGSSLKAIKKHITDVQKVDAEKVSPSIRKHLKSAVVSGELVQVKGKRANSSFKLSGKSTPTNGAVAKSKEAAVKKSPKEATPTVKKATPEKKTPLASPKTAAKKAPAKKESAAAVQKPTPKTATRKLPAARKAPPAKATTPTPPPKSPLKTRKSSANAKKSPVKKVAKKAAPKKK